MHGSKKIHTVVIFKSKLLIISNNFHFSICVSDSC
jgi:hypothetical protein